MKKYELVKDDLNIKTEVYYNKGGMNYFTSRNEERGYYLSISPVRRTYTGNIVTEIYTAFTGVKVLILPVKRQGDKSYNLAVNIAKEKEIYLKQRIIEQIN